MGLELKFTVAFIIALSSSIILITLCYPMISSRAENTTVNSLSSDAFKSDGSRYLRIMLSQTEGPFKLNVTQGSSTQINIVLSSLSKTTDFTIPLCLSVGAFENQQLSMPITSSPEPSPTLPLSISDDSIELAKPFEANFSINPITLKPEESKSVILTLTVLENTQPGKYTLFLENGNWEQTGLAAVTLQITVVSKKLVL
jgi:hypothetical protein